MSERKAIFEVLWLWLEKYTKKVQIYCSHLSSKKIDLKLQPRKTNQTRQSPEGCKRICRTIVAAKKHRSNTTDFRRMSGRFHDGNTRGGRSGRGGGRGRGRGYIAPGTRPVEENMRIGIQEKIEAFQRSEETGFPSPRYH